MFDRMKLSGLVAAAALAVGVSGAAQAATISIAGVSTPPAGNNDFLAELTAANATNFVTGGLLTLSGPARLTFSAVAAESGFSNSFTAGSGLLSEGTTTFGGGSNFLTSVVGGTFSDIFAGGLLDGLLTFANGLGFTADGGEFEFGVFFDAAVTNTLFLAFDDGEGRSGDDNHDDFIVRVNVSAVPVPAAGFLLVGALGGLAALRRRKALAA